MQIQAFVGRIQEERFGFKFFSEFDLVINALDNEEARKYVNNMCFNFNIPLVDSGTNGYAAQVSFKSFIKLIYSAFPFAKARRHAINA